MNQKLNILKKRMKHNSDRWKKETNNASFNSESPMKDKEKTYKTIIFVKKKELKRNMMKWLNNINKNIGNKSKILKKNLKLSDHKPCLLKKI